MIIFLIWVWGIQGYVYYVYGFIGLFYWTIIQTCRDVEINDFPAQSPIRANHIDVTTDGMYLMYLTYIYICQNT